MNRPRPGEITAYPAGGSVEITGPDEEIMAMLRRILDLNEAIVKQNAVIVNALSAPVWEVKTDE